MMMICCGNNEHFISLSYTSVALFIHFMLVLMIPF